MNMHIQGYSATLQGSLDQYEVDLSAPPAFSFRVICVLSFTAAAAHCTALRRNAPHCTTLHHTALHCNTLKYATTQCDALQHTATHYHSKKKRFHLTTIKHSASQKS